MGETLRVLCVFALIAGAACGDNIKPASDGGAAPDATAGDGGTPVCGDGVVSGDEACDDALGGACCNGCQLVAFGNECRAAAGECDAPEVCDGLNPECPDDGAVADGTACSVGFCQSGVCTECDIDTDSDFDGSNQCDDCNDSNGTVHPGAEESCDGVDEDCDGSIDEDFDVDGDTYSVCSDDPLLRDCDDSDSSVNPGAAEACGGDGQGNQIDDNCNGFVDETCQPCDETDDDGDGLSDCEGDCDDADADVSPDEPEVCDGADTDCNVFTVENCGVSDPCNFDSGADVCKEDLLCGCLLDGSGACSGDYQCTSFCQGSYTGPLGAGCQATQICQFRVTASDNQHGCAETAAPIGSLLAGEVCTADSECRSGVCDKLCNGPGCQTTRCVDFCDHHDPGAPGSCAAGTVCEVQEFSFMGSAMYAQCRLDDNGSGQTGDACTSGCAWGPSSCVSDVCAEPCGHDAHCPSGYHCSLEGNQVGVGTWGGPDLPAGVAGETAVETVPVCLADTGPGNHDRPAGAVCTDNSDCESQFCDASGGICVSLCVTDASCPPGLTCEPSFARAGDGIVFARVCTSSGGQLFEPL